MSSCREFDLIIIEVGLDTNKEQLRLLQVDYEWTMDIFPSSKVRLRVT